MRVVEAREDRITLSLTRTELNTIGNALAEICHRIGVADFWPRVGVPLEEALDLLRAIDGLRENSPEPHSVESTPYSK